MYSTQSDILAIRSRHKAQESRVARGQIYEDSKHEQLFGKVTGLDSGSASGPAVVGVHPGRMALASGDEETPGSSIDPVVDAGSRVVPVVVLGGTVSNGDWIVADLVNGFYVAKAGGGGGGNVASFKVTATITAATWAGGVPTAFGSGAGHKVLGLNSVGPTATDISNAYSDEVTVSSGKAKVVTAYQDGGGTWWLLTPACTEVSSS